MKKIITIVCLAMLIAPIQTVFGQACPIILNSQTLSVPGGYQEKITYNNPTSGAKSIKITIYASGNTVCYTECFQAISGGDQQTYLSPTFSCQPTQILIESFTGGINCGGTSCSSVLPVKLKIFTTSREGNNVSMKWITSSEQNNKGFGVERLVSNVWQQIAFISSKATGGSSNNDLVYSYADVNFSKEITQYRLNQINIDGKSSLSVVSIVPGSYLTNVQVWPNPAFTGGVINIVFDDKDKTHTVNLFDFSGKQIATWSNISGNSITLPKLVPGSYFLKIIGGSTTSTSKIFFIK